jgi:3-isopropylmalate/(R)-2-methylmalate dehydratase small subunit
MTASRFHTEGFQSNGFQVVESTLVPLPRRNIDTDQIIPAAFLKITDKSGLAAGLFANWRYDDPSSMQHPNLDFALNRPEHQNAKVLLAGDNFGCGSSREHAPWALVEYGFRVVISTRFADIFRNNALKNGLLVVTVSEEVSQRLFAAIEADPSVQVTINLVAQALTLPDGSAVPFDIGPFAKHCLLHGTDQLGYLVDQLPAIEQYESSHPPRIDTR